MYYIPANETAHEVGNAKTANMVMLGAVLEASKAVDPGQVISALEYIMGEKKTHLIPVNEKAMAAGADLVK